MAGFSPSTFLLAAALSGGGGGGGGQTVPTYLSELVNDTNFISSAKKADGSYLDYIYVDGSGTAPADVHQYMIKDVQFKRGSKSSLSSTVPKMGEPVFEYDPSAGTYRLKIGNGSTSYASLPYIGADFSLAADGKSVEMKDSKLQVFGFATTTTGKIPRKAANGSLEWISLDAALRLTAGDAVKITKSTAANGDITQKLDVLYDNSTIKLANGKLSVPIDNSTVQLKNGKITAAQPTAGNGIKITSSGGQQTISANIKAGANVTISTDATGQMTIGATGGTSGGDTIAEGKGVKITTSASTGVKTISGNYVAGQNIILTDRGSNQVEISVNPAAVNNTVRQVKVNGDEKLSKDSLDIPLEFDSTTVEPDGIRVTSLGGGKITMAINNHNITQINDKDMLTDLNNYIVTLDCGNAANNW